MDEQLHRRRMSEEHLELQEQRQIKNSCGEAGKVEDVQMWGTCSPIIKWSTLEFQESFSVIFLLRH